jgi:hypothetical protein
MDQKESVLEMRRLRKSGKEVKTMNVGDIIERAGTVSERAHREGRSLTRQERAIVRSAYRMAEEANIPRDRFNAVFMYGERNWEKVLPPIKVVAVFAYYFDPYEDIPALANYLIRESNHPHLPANGNVGAEDLIENGIDVPKTPTFDQWVKSGRLDRKVFKPVAFERRRAR